MFRRVPALLALAITVSAPLFASNAVMADGADGAGGIGAIGIRLLDVPTNLADDPRARVYIVDHVVPGTTIQRRAQVANKTHHSVQLSLYVGSAAIGGGAFIPADDQDPTDLTSWTSLSRSQVTLPPGSRRTVMATIRVPSTASKGERYGVIWASTTAGPPPGGGVTVVNRVGIRIYLSVGPGGEPTSAFTIESLTASRLPDGRPMVQAQVHNTGGRALDMEGYLRLSDGPDGLSAGPFEAQLGTTLAPGDSVPVKVPLANGLPAGPWLARIDLHSGLVEATAQATITFPAEPGSSAAPVAAETSSSRWPFILAICLASAALLGVLGWLRARRRPDGGTSPQTAVRKPENTVQR
jgi:hypothetical protein